MRKVLAIAAIVAMVAVTPFAALAAGSKEHGGGSSGGGSSSGGTLVGNGAYNLGPAVSNATIGSETNPVNVSWIPNADGTWSATLNGKKIAGWVCATNPYGQTEADKKGWFFADSNGKLLVGWQILKGADGLYHEYFFTTAANGAQGKLLTNTVTPDGFNVDADGHKLVNGVIVSKTNP